MIQFKENAQTDGRTDGRMEGWTDRSYFIGPFQLLLGAQKSKLYVTIQKHFPKNIDVKRFISQ